MTDGSRYTADELIMLHELEPDYHEVIVEGRRDVAVVSWYLRSREYEVDVFAVTDRVYMENDAITSRGLEAGERGRIITLAAVWLERSVDTTHITFIVDADYELAFPPDRSDPDCLLFTDGTSIEMYCFDHAVVCKFLQLALRSPESQNLAERALDAITYPLRQLFAVRLALHRLPNQPSLPVRFLKRLRLEPSVEFDIDGLLNASTDNRSQATAARAMYDTLLPNLPPEARQSSNGHDFPVLLGTYLLKANPELFRDDRIGYKDADVICATLLTCLDVNSLSAEPLFIKLEARLAVGPV